ncbi:MAG: 16S rRNA (uracil(1498)-N(3))-methyltransferase [Arcobacter sp.]|nr:MAG: 16S rRNA (uracil(1498)-N(3))-methyltransferase [Arcobacter sp.]
MQFTFHEESGSQFLEIDGDIYKYLFKARRHKVNENIYFRNLKDKILYLYKVNTIDRRRAICELISSEEKIIENSRKLHLAWCMVDPKTVEKSIASLNELGVDKITFVHCDYSQKNFKQNFEKLEKILINSSSQCGRSSIVKLDNCSSLDEFLEIYPNSFILDFSTKNVSENTNVIETLIIGCEGGFSSEEREKFEKEKIVGFDSKLILRSETAIISASSKILI